MLIKIIGFSQFMFKNVGDHTYRNKLKRYHHFFFADMENFSKYVITD